MFNLGFRDWAILGLCLSLHLTYRYRYKRQIPLPPGPAGWPIIGNALSIPLTYSHIYYKALGKKLGTKILYLEALGQAIIVINDLKMAKELLDRRSATYSSRPQSRMVVDVVGFPYFFGLMPYGEDWRMCRRLFQQHFSEKELPRMREKGLEFIRKGLLVNLMSSPERLHDHVRHCIGGMATSLTYGLPIKRDKDPLVNYAEESFPMLAAAAGPGKYLVNVLAPAKYIPRWMPGGGFKQEARDMYERWSWLMEEPYKATLNAMKDGTAPRSFIADALEQSSDRPDSDIIADYAKKTAVQIYGAFSETTVAAFMTFALAMLKRPDVQFKAQQEVDEAVGPDRLPEFSDIPNLKYLSIIVKEALRWNPIAPMGIPHMTTQEDVYNGYYIPNNCTILANAYAMLHDEDIFPNPTEFKPERFLKSDGTILEGLLDPETDATFGFGRRICPGAHIAESTLYIFAASFLYLFDISPALDDGGNQIHVVPNFTASSLTSEPLPFPCRVTPRQGKDVPNLLKEFLGTDPI